MPPAESSSDVPSVLVVDDDIALGKVMLALLDQAGMRAAHAVSGEAAIAALASRAIDVVITDVRMPGMDGLEVLAYVGKKCPGVPVIVMTAHATVSLAVDAMRAGAVDFLQKPFDRDEVVAIVRRAFESRNAAADEPPARPLDRGARISSASPAMREVIERIDRAAKTSSTVLLRGESGTGKEVAAREIHERSARAKGPFVAVHCAAVPDELLESELFGYEKGAFTGAVGRKPGRVELANGGTLFLDEIGDVTPLVQVKLLRLLQEKEFVRLGGGQPERVDARFVAATHRDLEQMVSAGSFREDLLYRLSVLPIELPPLRHRPEDVRELAAKFVATIGAENGRPNIALAREAIARLEREPWPGNVRQLQHFIERLVVFSDRDALGVEDVEAELARSVKRPDAAAIAAPRAEAIPTDASLGAQRDEAERAAIRAALERAGGNRTLAARLLGIGRRTLYKKLDSLGLADA